MIPMTMGEQDVDGLVRLCQALAQCPDARAGVQYQVVTTGQFDIDARGIAAVFDGSGPR
jgi:hypothetical protein